MSGEIKRLQDHDTETDYDILVDPDDLAVALTLLAQVDVLLVTAKRKQGGFCPVCRRTECDADCALNNWRKAYKTAKEG